MPPRPVISRNCHQWLTRRVNCANQQKQILHTPAGCAVLRLRRTGLPFSAESMLCRRRAGHCQAVARPGRSCTSPPERPLIAASGTRQNNAPSCGSGAPKCPDVADADFELGFSAQLRDFFRILLELDGRRTAAFHPKLSYNEGIECQILSSRVSRATGPSYWLICAAS
jgi:hypothetical protein